MVKKSKNKSVAKSAGMWKGIALTLIVIAVFSFVGSFFFSASNTGKLPTDENGQVTLNTPYCNNNPAKTLKLRIEDELSATNSYINGTVYIENLATGSITEASVTTGGTSGFTSVATDLVCGQSEGYKVYIKGAGTSNSDGILEITSADLKASTTVIEKTFKASQFSSFKVSAYDEKNRAVAYDSANSSSYVVSLTSTFYDGTGSTAWTVGANDYLSMTFDVASNTSNRAFGSGMIIAVDSSDDTNTADWDEDTIEMTYEGAKLTPIAKSSLSEADQLGLSAYDVFYKVEVPVGSDGNGGVDAVKKLGFYIASADVDPDFDPKIRIVPVGDYKSTKTESILKGVGFQDDTSSTPLYSAQTITLAVD